MNSNEKKARSLENDGLRQLKCFKWMMELQAQEQIKKWVKQGALIQRNLLLGIKDEDKTSTNEEVSKEAEATESKEPASASSAAPEAGVRHKKGAAKLMTLMKPILAESTAAAKSIKKSVPKATAKKQAAGLQELFGAKATVV